MLTIQFRFPALILSLLLAGGCACGEPAVESEAVSTSEPIASAAEEISVTGTDDMTFYTVQDGQTIALDDAVISGGSVGAAITVGSLGTLTATNITASAESGILLSLTGGTASFTGSTLAGESTVSGTSCLMMEDCSLQSGGGDALFVLSSGNTDMTLTRVAVKGETEGLLILNSVTLNLAADETDLSGTVQMDDSSELHLTLSSGASYTGSFDADACRYVTISLDDTSKLILTADSYIESISGSTEELEAILERIESNGFTLYYNAENVQSDWLNARVYELPGGGMLSPLI